MKREFVRVSHPDEKFNIRTITINSIDSSYLRKTHFHNSIECIIVSQGEIVCTIEGSAIPLKKGDCILINQNIIHSIDITCDTATFTYIQFDISDFLSNTNTLYISNKDNVKYYIDQNNQDLSPLFEDILQEYTNQKENYEIYIHSCIMRLIVCMSRLNIINVRKLSGKNTDDIVYNTIKYLHKNYHQQLTLDKISKEFNISKYHLSHTFKNVTGTTIMEYLTTIRFSHIETLLIESNKNISQIAYECGFPSIQHFNKVFKKTKGLSPTQYKKYSHEILNM